MTKNSAIGKFLRYGRHGYLNGAWQTGPTGEGTRATLAPYLFIMSHTIDARIGRDRYRTEIRAGRHLLIADEPQENNGQDLGFTPHQLLAAALGACTNATLRMYADRKGWPLEAVDTHVEITHGDTFDTTEIHRRIRFTGELSQEQRERLLQIAERCPIHRTLTGELRIRTEAE